MSTAQEANGVLRTRAELYHAARHMIGSLHDQWSEFLPPSQASPCTCSWQPVAETCWLLLDAAQSLACLQPAACG